MDDDFPIEDVKAAVAEWRSIREFFAGDFHLLLPLTVSYHDWCAWQFHREDLNAGIAMFFRRHCSPFPTMDVDVKRIDPTAARTWISQTDMPENVKTVLSTEQYEPEPEEDT